MNFKTERKKNGIFTRFLKCIFAIKMEIRKKGDFLIRFQLSLFQFYSSYVHYDSICSFYLRNERNFPKLN